MKVFALMLRCDLFDGDGDLLALAPLAEIDAFQLGHLAPAALSLDRRSPQAVTYQAGRKCERNEKKRAASHRSPQIRRKVRLQHNAQAQSGSDLFEAISVIAQTSPW